MSKKIINHDIRSVNGKHIELPCWKGGEDDVVRELAIPDVYVTSTTQKYPIGTKFVDDDRVFHYGYLHTDEDVGGARAGQGLGNLNECKSTTTDAVEHAIGATAITIEDTASTVNEWAGGFFCPMSSPYGITYRVLSNTVQDGEHSILTLERGLVVAVAASTADCRLNANQYSKLLTTRASGRHYVSFMGCSPIQPVASSYQWVQTWGPCNVMGGDEIPGSENGLRMGQFNIDGTLVWDAWAGQSANQGHQLAGYVINSTGTGTTASWFIYLMVAR